MITGLDLNETQDYVLKGDTNNPTIWKIGVIPSYLFAKVTAEEVSQIDVAFKVLQLGLKGWTNSNIEYRREQLNINGSNVEAVPISILERFPLPIVTELCKKIIEVNQVSEIERKN